MSVKRGAGVTAGFVGVVAGLVTLLEWVGVEFADLRGAVVGASPLFIAILLLAGLAVVAVAFTVWRTARARPEPSGALTSPQLPAAPEQPSLAPQTRQGCVSI